MNTATVKSFVKSFVALVQGDSADAQAQKTFRQVQSALNTQIAVMTGDLVSKEEAVSDAQEAFDKARINHGKELASSDRTQYVRNLVEAKNNVEKAQEALNDHKETLSFLKEQLAQLEAEVVAS
jgi:4-hydroxy-3-methylbut-2-en-1-yl diphosphate synthase IspG/GcpE